MIRKIVAVVLKLVSDDFELQLQCNISMVTYFPQKKVQKMSRFYKPVKTAAQKYRGKITSHRCAIITCTAVSCLSTAACMYRGFNRFIKTDKRSDFRCFSKRWYFSEKTVLTAILFENFFPWVAYTL